MYNELCDKLSQQNANNFIAVFNELDKYFDTLVEQHTDRFMPFNEKVKLIWQEKIALWSFVKKYEQKLKYFWELRNEIAHWFKIDGMHYCTPSYHAVEELRKIKEAIMQPITVTTMFQKQVFVCTTTDLLKDTMIAMKNFGYTHVPVYNEQKIFQWVLTQSAICEWLAYHMQDTTKPLETVRINDVDLQAWIESHAFIEKDKPLFGVPQLFESIWLQHKILGALLITETGNQNEPLMWIITTYDLPHITDYNYVA